MTFYKLPVQQFRGAMEGAPVLTKVPGSRGLLRDHGHCGEDHAQWWGQAQRDNLAAVLTWRRLQGAGQSFIWGC